MSIMSLCHVKILNIQLMVYIMCKQCLKILKRKNGWLSPRTQIPKTFFVGRFHPSFQVKFGYTLYTNI